MRAIVLLNPAAGNSAACTQDKHRENVANALSAARIEADIRIVTGAGLADAAKAAAESETDTVIAGGGDGTLSTVAGALADKGVPLGILPLGTLNHFAKDLGIPFDLLDAARVISAKNVAKVDVGEVNGRVFINNSSLGIYPRFVLDRDAWRSRYGWQRWPAMLIAMFKVFRRFPLVNVRLVIDETTVIRKTPFVFIGNNDYRFDLLNIGERSGLDRGELFLYVINASNRWSIIKLTVRALFGRLAQARDFDGFRFSSCSIESGRRRMHVAADGEVIRFRPPLQYRVRRGALSVCVPKTRSTHDQCDPAEQALLPDNKFDCHE